MDLTDGPACVLAGPAALASRVELAVTGNLTVAPAAVRQGEPLLVTANLRNYGGKSAERVKVTAKAGTGPAAGVLASEWMTLKAFESRPVTLRVDTSRRDGPLTVVVTVDSDARFSEISESDNRQTAEATIVPDWSRWDSHVDLRVTAEGPADSPLVRLPCPEAVGSDPASLRVLVGDVSVPAQVLPGPDGPELVFVWPDPLPAGETRPCRLYMDSGNRHEPRSGPRWDATRANYLGPLYQVTFSQGAIIPVTVGDLPILSYLQTSSGDTGWVTEQDEGHDLRVIADGPVCTVIEVRKTLPKGHSYHKRYEFFDDFFTVTTLSPERFGTMSRAYYVAKGRIEDDKGNAAVIDGQGEAEGFAGVNPGPKWYATWDQAANWALNAVAVTPHNHLTYWDGGHMAGVGFETGDPAPATVAYFPHHEPFGPDFDPRAQAEADYRRAHAKVTVKR